MHHSISSTNWVRISNGTNEQIANAVTHCWVYSNQTDGSAAQRTRRTPGARCRPSAPTTRRRHTPAAHKLHAAITQAMSETENNRHTRATHAQNNHQRARRANKEHALPAWGSVCCRWLSAPRTTVRAAHARAGAPQCFTAGNWVQMNLHRLQHTHTPLTRSQTSTAKRKNKQTRKRMKIRR